MWVINHGVLINFNYAASNFIFSLSLSPRYLLRPTTHTHTHIIICILLLYIYTTNAADDGESCEAAAAEAAVPVAAAVGGPRNSAAAEAEARFLSRSLTHHTRSLSLSHALSLSPRALRRRHHRRRRRRRRMLVMRLQLINDKTKMACTAANVHSSPHPLTITHHHHLVRCSVCNI